MQIYIDQSGKIENTAKRSVLALTNSKTAAVIIPAKEKRRLQEWFRRKGMPRLFVDATFATALYLLIRNHVKADTVFVVDIEYPKHTEIIQKMVNSLSSKEIKLRWKSIGKSSKAHDIAYKVYKGKVKLGRKLKARKIWNLAIKIAGGYLNPGLSPESRYSVPANKNIIYPLKQKVKKKEKSDIRPVKRKYSKK